MLVIGLCLNSVRILLLIFAIDKNGNPVEYSLYLANISAPKVGTPQREEEPYAYEAKKWLMDKVVGQKAEFIVEYEVKERECGTLMVKGENINVEIAKTGLVKLMEKKKDAPASKFYNDIVKGMCSIKSKSNLVPNPNHLIYSKRRRKET